MPPPLSTHHTLKAFKGFKHMTQEQNDLEDAQKRLDLDLDQCDFFIQFAKAGNLEVKRAGVGHWFFNADWWLKDADWWLKEAEKELEARPDLKSVKNGFYRDAISEKRSYLNTVRKTSND